MLKIIKNKVNIKIDFFLCKGHFTITHTIGTISTMSVSLKEIRTHLPRVLNMHYGLLPRLFSELRQRRPRILPAAVHSPRRVRFAFDNPDLMLKPKPMTVATYIKNTEPQDCLVVKTRDEIFQDEMRELQLMKRSANAWRPRRGRIVRAPLTKEQDEAKAFADLAFNPLEINNL